MPSRYSLATQRALIILIVLTLAMTLIPAALLAAPPAQSPTVYIVQWGDTLFSISMRFHTTVPALMAANGLTNYNIYAGQRLILPPYSPPVTTTPPPTPSNYTCKYTVQYRDTVYSIAYRYQIPWQSLMQANYLYAPYIQPGQMLNVPCLTPEPTPFPTYTVKSGDNVFRIAIQYKTSVYAIALVNGLYSPNWIFPGQNLVIPYPNSIVWPVVPTVTPVATATPGTPAPSATPSGITPTATTPTSSSGVVVMSNGAFIPGSITVLLSNGGTMLWKNTENATHTVTSGVPGAIDNKFRSNQLGNGQSFSFTFIVTGTYPYFSETDPGMTGTIVVK